MIGVAILGAGDIANVHIEAYLRLCDRCRIVALADLFIEKAKEKREKYGLDCDVVSDYKQLLDCTDINLVSICLPPAVHCQVSVDFLRAGKNILCEKPMAPSLAECDQMIAASVDSGTILSIVAQNRFKSDIMKTKKIIDSDVLGRLYFAQANSFWWRGDNYYDLWWRGTWEKESGGCTFIHAVHHIDLLLWLMGDVEAVTSMVDNQNHHNSEVEDVSLSIVRFKNGAVGSMLASLFHHGESQKIIIDGQNGSIEIPHKINVSRQMQNGYPEDDNKARDTLEKEFESISDLIYEEHCGQIENVLSAIQNKAAPLITGEDGRKTVEFISAVYQSSFTGKSVRFPMTEKDPFYTREGILNRAIRFNEKKKSVESYADIGIKVGGTL